MRRHMDRNASENCHSDDEDFLLKYQFSKAYHNKASHKYGRSILKSRENIFKQKSRCNSVLKKKLKKYKLRKDGQEDPDVVDVSQCLSTSLKIKSPVGINNNRDDVLVDEWKIENYLTKMAKRSSLKMKTKEQEGEDGFGENTKDVQVKAKNDRKTIGSEQKMLEKNAVFNLEKSIEKNPAEDKEINKPKEMNAFQLMMNARNKSIGSNSPGKEKTAEFIEEESAKKSLKITRNLALEKMSLAKGYLKNKEMEVVRDEMIKVKMLKRAKRLKNMLNYSTHQLSSSENPNSEDSGDNSKKSNQMNKNKRCRKSEKHSEKVPKRMKIETSENTVIHLDDDSENNEVNHEVSQNTEESSCSSTKSIKTNNIPKEGSHLCKKISKSDVDFLNMLSPSIKKRESMLSYYDKVEKKIESKVEDYFQPDTIKVKITPRRKKKKKAIIAKQNKNADTCNITNNKESESDDAFETEEKEIAVEENFLNRNNVSKVSKKKKEHMKFHKSETKPVSEEIVHLDVKDGKSHRYNDTISETTERRSKRVSKKPIKYQDMIDSNSDDDLFVLAPENSKTKTMSPSSLKLRKKANLTLKNQSVEEVASSKSEKQKKPSNKIDKIIPAKLAPIFVSKTQVNKIENEAKQRFLQSGIPDQLKKIIEKQKSFDLENDNFTVVHHIQQKTSNSENLNFNPWTLELMNLNLSSEENDCEAKAEIKTWNSNLKYETLDRVDGAKTISNNKEKLKVIKINYPKFPVYRTFRLLKNKCMPDKHCSQNYELDEHEKSGNVIQDFFETKLDDPNVTMWSEKFKPSSTSDIIGNFEAVNTVKKWLTDRKEANLDSKNQQSRHRSDSSDSSDFYYPSDTDSRDSIKSYNNVLVVTGPVGSGKTSTIYAVAKELAIKIIEVNASTKRTGKMILSTLQEATQSHKVNRGTTSTENSQNSQELSNSQPKINKNNHLKTYSKKHSMAKNFNKSKEVLNSSQLSKTEDGRTCMSLILIEDADLVFEQDDGFISALHQIIQTSKRPVILVTSSITCSHLQRYITSGNVVKFHHLSPKMLGTWLDVMCLVENGDIWTKMGQNLLEYFEGDIRKSINILQFWVASDQSNDRMTDSNEFLTDSNELLPNTDSQDMLRMDDECSTVLLADQEPRAKDKETNHSVENVENLNKVLFGTFVSAHDHDIGIKTSVLQFPVNHLNIWWNIPRIFGFEEVKSDETSSLTNSKDCLTSLARLIDSISASDLMSARMRPNVDASIVSSPWKNKLCDGVSEAANMSSYNNGLWLGDSMSYALLTSSVKCTTLKFGINEEKLCVDYTLPGMSYIRSRDRIISRHSGLYDSLSLSCHLDRRGVATDYLSTCRQICRIEKDKSDNNSKRHNRFCHYLKSAKMPCSSDTLDLLCDSLNSVK